MVSSLNTRLKNCQSCNEKISLSAKHCPKCGSNDPFLFKELKELVPVPLTSPFDYENKLEDRTSVPITMILIWFATLFMDYDGLPWVTGILGIVISIIWIVNFENKNLIYLNFREKITKKHNKEYFTELEEEYKYWMKS